MWGIGPPEPEQKSTTFQLLLLSDCDSSPPSEEEEVEISSITRKTSRITAEASSAGDWGCRKGMRVVQCFVRVFWAHCFSRKGTLFFVGVSYSREVALGVFRFFLGERFRLIALLLTILNRKTRTIAIARLGW